MSMLMTVSGQVESLITLVTFWIRFTPLMPPIDQCPTKMNKNGRFGVFETSEIYVDIVLSQD